MKRLRNKKTNVSEKLSVAGLRPTRQRIQLGELLFACSDCRHVTAEALHQEAQSKGIHVSLATVYNTLHQFNGAGLVRHISLDTGKSYFDTNTGDHHHFLNEDTGELMDIPANKIRISGLPNAPTGTSVESVDVVIRVRDKRRA